MSDEPREKDVRTLGRAVVLLERSAERLDRLALAADSVFSRGLLAEEAGISQRLARELAELARRWEGEE